MKRIPSSVRYLKTVLGLLFTGSLIMLPISCSENTPCEQLDADAYTASVNWPQFRGIRAGGVAASMNTPVQWDVGKGNHIRWKTLFRA